MTGKNSKELAACVRAAFALPVLVLPFAAQAESDPYFEEFPIVASVSRLPQRLSETPAAVTVIDQDMIRASGMRTVEDLLRLVPGFQVTSHNQDPAIVTYHGLTSGMSNNEYGLRVQVLIDGRSQYSPLFKGGVNWNLLPVALENIERIEVTRGPNTVSYGSNAFMGVVNIITVDPSLTRGWLFSANHGNNGIRDETLRWGASNDDSAVRFTYKSLQDDGFQKGYFNNAWWPMPDSRQSQLADFRFDKQLTERDELQLTATMARDYSQYGRPVPSTSDPRRNLEQTSNSLGLLWRHVVSSDEEYKLRYAFTQDWAYGPYTMSGSFKNALNQTVNYSTLYDPGGRSSTHELEFEHRFAPFQKTRLSWGAGAKSLDLVSYGQFSTYSHKHRDDYRIFGNLEYRPVDAWLFNVGTSLDHDSISGYLFDWRAGASYHLTEENTVRFVKSRAHRTPSLYETAGLTRIPGVVQNTSIAQSDTTFYSAGVDAERIDSLELGYLGEFKSLRTSIDVRMFSERIPNLIEIVPLALPIDMADNKVVAHTIYGGADGALNITNVRIHGYEYQARWTPWDSSRLIYSNALISIDGSIGSGIADDAANINKIFRQTLESAPVRSQSAMLIQQLPMSLQLSVMYFHSSPMRLRRNDRDGLQLPASERIDWRLSKAFKVGNTTGEVAFTTQMTNGDQYGRNLSRMAERMHWVSLRLGF